MVTYQRRSACLREYVIIPTPTSSKGRVGGGRQARLPLPFPRFSSDSCLKRRPRHPRAPPTPTECYPGGKEAGQRRRHAPPRGFDVASVERILAFLPFASSGASFACTRRLRLALPPQCALLNRQQNVRDAGASVAVSEEKSALLHPPLSPTLTHPRGIFLNIYLGFISRCALQCGLSHRPL